METILSIIAIAISVISGGFTLYTFYWTAARDRKQATLEAFNRLQGEVFDKLNTYKPAEIRDICNDKKSDKYKTISGYLARIEHFCVGLNCKIYDKRTFYALAHGFFDGHQIRSRIEPLIKNKNISNNSKELFYNDTLSVLAWMEKRATKK
jgi:hypothetical protein